MFSCCMTETTIGIIIGSAFTLLGVIVNGVIAFLMSRSSHNREIEEHKRSEQKKDADEKKAKREKSYRDFANYYGVMNMLLVFSYATKESQINGNALGEMFVEKYKETLSRSAEVISEVSLYGSGKVVENCIRYAAIWSSACQRFEAISVGDLENLDRELLLVINEMKKELGFDSF